jgi:4-hydroxy-tetrahydrodipicolinate synthase
MMTGYAFPEMLVRVQALLRAGDTAAARDLFDLHLPLIRYELQPGLGLAVRKHVLVLRGILGCAALRPPGPRLSAETMAEVEALYARVVAKDAGLG